MGKISTDEPQNPSLNHNHLHLITPNSYRRKSSFDVLADVTRTNLKEIGTKVYKVRNTRLFERCRRFGAITTAHGIPMVCAANRWIGRIFWTLLILLCTAAFAFQFTLVFEKFNRKEKIINVELQFKTAAFPSVTICNLNPFKKHLASTVPEISETLDAFHQAVTFSKDVHHHQLDDVANNRRTKRSNSEDDETYRYVQYEPVISACDCTQSYNNECIQSNDLPESDQSLCLCSYDRQDLTAWPCFNASLWKEQLCPECNDIGYCNLPHTGTGADHIPCVCQQQMKYCLVKPERVRRIWEFRGRHVPDKKSPYRADFMAQLAQLGYENMTDEVAITAKTKEKLVLTMAGLPAQRRIALSYGKSEFIQMCSFNGQQCDIINDFKLHVDPAFGNCYTFNANRVRPLISSRAGPGYGLRLMVFVNASDYLPITEATGVRIAIHDPNEFPFPDTFGYSAPTGFVSSFGISMRKVNRLPKPYGDCVRSDIPLPSNYIYSNYKYEPEGCYKSCYQHSMVLRCGCADPRYPAPNNSHHCDSFNELQRNCVIRQGIRLTRAYTCKCKHPCQQNVYSTTYSAAKWPSGSVKVGDCEKTDEQCIAYYNTHAAMLEIYYEQLSFEILTESASYLFVNLVSDVGGQLGLWLGVSIITVVEFIVFFANILSLFFQHVSQRFYRQQRKQPIMLNNIDIDDDKSEHINSSMTNVYNNNNESNIHLAQPEMYTDRNDLNTSAISIVVTDSDDQQCDEEVSSIARLQMAAMSSTIC